MIFQPGNGGSSGGLIVKTGYFANSSLTATINFDFEAKAVIVEFVTSPEMTGLLAQGDSLSVSGNGREITVSLSNNGRELMSSPASAQTQMRYLALG